MRKILPLFILLALALTACGDTVEVTRTVQVEVTRIVEVTRLVVITATPSGPTATLPVFPTSTPRPTATNIPRPGPDNLSGQVTPAPTTAPAAAPKLGQELIGQTGTFNDLKATVTGVDTYTVLNDSKGQPTIKAQGYFLIITFEVENIGKEPHSFIFANIVDGKGRKFSTTSNVDASLSVSFSGKYKSTLSYNPGLKGPDYEVFEVPADASNFKLNFGL